MNADDYYGRGLSYPLRLAPAGLAESAGVSKVEESIRIVLGTQYGERVMRPTFGCNLMALAFAPNNTATAHLARYYVEDGLRRCEPRIDVIEVLVENDSAGGRLLIHVHYRLKATPDVQSLVYPFYLEQP